MAQTWLHEQKIRMVTVYHMHKTARVNIGEWKRRSGFKNDDERDQGMTLDSTVDLAIVHPDKRVYDPTSLDVLDTRQLIAILSRKQSKPGTNQGQNEKKKRLSGTERNLIRRRIYMGPCTECPSVQSKEPLK